MACQGESSPKKVEIIHPRRVKTLSHERWEVSRDENECPPSAVHSERTDTYTRTGVWRSIPLELARFQCLLEIHPFCSLALPPPRLAALPPAALPPLHPTKSPSGVSCTVYCCIVGCNLAKRFTGTQKSLVRVNLSTHVTHIPACATRAAA